MTNSNAPWEALGISEHQWIDEKNEWVAWVDDLKIAVDNGYFDEHLADLVNVMLKRRKDIGVVPVKRKRPAGMNLGTSTAAPGVAPAAPTQQDPDNPPGVELVAMPGHYQGRTGTIEGNDGQVYSKHDIYKAGQRFIISGGKWKGMVLKVVKVNRTMAECVVLEARKYPVGTRVKMSIPSIIDEINRYNAKYGVKY